MRKILFLAVLSCPLAGSAQHFVTGVRVAIAPPALRLEVVPVAPSPQYQWIAGYWAWRAGKHVWVEGHWALPPAPGYVWQPASWEKQGGVWFFFEGHWRPGDVPDPNVIYQPPPPPGRPEVIDTAPPGPIEEIRPSPPFPDAVWISGYWEWSGIRYVWVTGRWSPRPRGYDWEDYRWKHRHDGRWEHKHGHWHPREDDD